MFRLFFTAIGICCCLMSYNSLAQNTTTHSTNQTIEEGAEGLEQNKVMKVEDVAQGKQLYSPEELNYRLSYFFQGSWEQLRQTAFDQKTRFFVQFETPWCRVCKKMNHEVFARDRVIDYARQYFMAYKLDGEQRADIAQLYGIEKYPVTLFFDYDGRMIARIDGGLSEEDFMHYMKTNTVQIPHTKYSKFR